MKKRIGLLAACLFGLVLCLNGLVGCSDAPKEKPQITVASASVQIDRKTESVRVLDGVTAVDMNGKDLTDRVTVSCPEGGMSLSDGEATFAECGDYTLVYSVSDDYGQTATAEKTVFVRNIYSVYLTNATVPFLYGALDVASNEYPFIFYNERTVLNVTRYGERALATSVTESGIAEEDYTSAVAKFLQLYEQDDDAYFRVFVSDACNQILLREVVSNGISEARYEVKYLSEGTKSYDTAFPYLGDDAYETWLRQVDIYDHMVELAKNGEELSYDGVSFATYLSDELGACYLYAAAKSNAEFWGAYPEALHSVDLRVQAEIDKANLVKKQPHSMYNALTNTQKSNFLQSVDFNKSEFDEKYFNEDGNYLIIIGAKFIEVKDPLTGEVTGVTMGDTLPTAQVPGILERICEDYAGYNILFKPHPSGIPSQEEAPEIYNFMVEHDIKILPGSLPMEVITWAYGQALIGGFDSSLYMAAPQGNTKFFIAEDKTALSGVSRQLYESGVFGAVTFYWPQETA